MASGGLSYFVPSRDDFDVRRADLGLGLRGAARYYNEAVVPGIGGAWRVRHLTWAVAGLALRGEATSRSAATLAHAVEALGNKVAWSLDPDQGRARFRGRRAFVRAPDVWAFEQLVRRTNYVQVTHRQQVTRALPGETGLNFTEGSSRYNAMRLSPAGQDLAEAFLRQTVPARGQPSLGTTLRKWIHGDFDPAGYQRGLVELVSPSHATSHERAIVKARLDTPVSRSTELGRRDPSRRVRLAKIVATAGALDGDSLRAAILANDGHTHVLDIDAALAFDAMRAAAVQVLAGVARAIQHQERRSVSELVAEAEVAASIVALRSVASEYQQRAALCGPLRGDVAAFVHSTGSDDVAVVAELLRRDGRVLVLAGDRVIRGAVYRPELGVRDVEEDEVTEEDETTKLHGRLSQFISLWRSCEGS